MAAPLRTGGRLPVAVVLVLGFSNIFADALSMGVGEYLSSKVRPVAISDESKGKERAVFRGFFLVFFFHAPCSYIRIALAVMQDLQRIAKKWSCRLHTSSKYAHQ